MDAAALAVVCVLNSSNPTAYPLPSNAFSCPASNASSSPSRLISLAALRPVVSSPTARDALARTVVAEAGNQGDSGLAGVVYTILNRLADGRWGGTVEAVVDAPGQFEPVMRAGGSWRRLRAASATQQARVDTIVNLVLDGRLPDLTGGARYFQNSQIVAAQARAGSAPASLVDFGGAAPSAVIGAHSFYVDRGPHVDRSLQPLGFSASRLGAGAAEIFVGENGVERVSQRGALRAERSATRPPVSGDADIFVP